MILGLHEGGAWRSDEAPSGGISLLDVRAEGVGVGGGTACLQKHNGEIILSALPALSLQTQKQRQEHANGMP